MSTRETVIAGTASGCILCLSLGVSPVLASPVTPQATAAAAFAFWTAERRAAVIPRKLVVDQRGLGYLLRPDGRLVPHGHLVAPMASDATPRRGPPGGDGPPGGGGGGGGEESGSKTKVVRNSAWQNGGTIQNASGRILFEMADGYYVCSGTVVEDATAGRSVILTAAHCVYDDVAKAFAKNVIFIPNQDGTTGSGTDFDCSNDPLGCWAPSFGVVAREWTETVFPNNIPADYAYYVVPDSGAHSGAGNAVVLDSAAPPMAISFDPADAGVGSKTTALGYSYSDDPNFMYCVQDMGIEGVYGDYWLSSCKLSGGASGGAWTQSTASDLGDGPVISVNSWGYTGQPGMGGPPLAGNKAACLLEEAKSTDLASNGVVDCWP